MTARKKQLFHQTFAATGSLSAAARAAGISQAEARMLRKSAPDQISTSQTAASRAAASLRAAVATLESEAVRRALEGVNVPVFHQGRECGSTVKHSDTLLMFLLKTLNPARYGAGATSESVAGPDHAKGRKPLTLDIDLSAAGEPWAEEDTENGMGERKWRGGGRRGRQCGPAIEKSGPAFPAGPPSSVVFAALTAQADSARSRTVSPGCDSGPTP